MLEHSFMVKSWGWKWAGGYVVSEQAAMWWVAHVIIVSAQSKELGFLGFLDLVWP